MTSLLCMLFLKLIVMSLWGHEVCDMHRCHGHTQGCITFRLFSSFPLYSLLQSRMFSNNLQQSTLLQMTYDLVSSRVTQGFPQAFGTFSMTPSVVVLFTIGYMVSSISIAQQLCFTFSLVFIYLLHNHTSSHLLSNLGSVPSSKPLTVVPLKTLAFTETLIQLTLSYQKLSSS